MPKKTHEFSVASRKIGPGHPTYIIAEMSANHHQDLEIAKEIVRVAHAVGADAIKTQTYLPEQITLNCKNDYFQIKGNIWEGKNLYELYQEAYMPWEWHHELKSLAAELGLDFFSTPTNIEGVDYLEALGVPVYKVPSFEVNDVGLLRHIGSKKMPVIMSTGMASLADIEEALAALRQGGATDISLLKCTSAYPAPVEEMNLVTLQDIAERFDVVVGLSDHSTGIAAPVAAVAIGASIIEKHFCLDRSVDGPDSAFSLEPEEFQQMVEAVRFTEKALGKVSYEPKGNEAKSQKYRRSLFIAENIAAGEVFNPVNLRSVRPGDGLHPRHLDELLGKQAACDISAGTPMDWKFVADD